MRAAFTSMRGLVRIACVFALVMIGFAHKPVSAYPLIAQISDYQLPDGSFASICLDEHDTKPHAVKVSGCEACRLTNAILLPAAPAVDSLAVILARTAKILEREHQLARALYPPNSGPRAPPESQMFA